MYIPPASAPALLMTMLALTLFSGYSSHLAAADEAPVRPARIETISDPASERWRSFPAEVKASRRTELAFRVAGQLIELRVREGEAVRKDQILARLDPADYEVVLQQRQAEFELAREQYNRYSSMVKRKLVSPAQFDQKKAELAVARAALSRATLDLEYTTLKAPYAGTVSRRLLENFQNLQAKETVLILQSADQLDVEFQLPETIFALTPRPRAEQGSAQVYFDALPEQPFIATYRERSTEADAATGAYTVTLSLKKPPQLELYPGMTARVAFDLSSIFDIGPAHLYLPVEAVFSAEQRSADSTRRQIWKVNPDTMTVFRADVTVGRLSSRGIQILDGLAPGEMVVTAGVHYLREGQKVRHWVRERGL